MEERLNERSLTTPNPDPTLATIAILLRENSNLRELFESRLEALRVRMGERDKAVELLERHVGDVPTEMSAKIAQLQSLVDEMFNTIEQRFITMDQKFIGIETQFRERDERVRESATARDTAVAAALQAQKEAAGAQNESLTLSIDKSEKSTSEQISQQGTLLQTSVGSLNDKISAVDTRMTRIESLGLGTSAANDAQRANHTSAQQDQSHTLAIITAILGGIFGLVGLVSAIIAIASRLH